MSAVQTDAEEHRGNVVAVEGDANVISTQLRLLPPSPNILVLPALSETIALESGSSFVPRVFIRSVHKSFASRTEAARLFVESATPKNSRLVFLNGGSVGARTMCITEISEKLTGGEAIEAESIYNEIVKDGVAGLMRQDEEEQAQVEQEMEDGSKSRQEISPQEGETQREESPVMIAMRKADSLDRETAALQPECYEVVYEPTNETERDAEQKTVAFEQNETQKIGDEREVETENGGKSDTADLLTAGVNQKDERRNTFGPGIFPETVQTTIEVEEAYPASDFDDDLDATSPDEQRFSIPLTPSVLEFGEAYVIDIQKPKHMRPLRRVKSLDRIDPENSRIRRDSTALKLKRSLSIGAYVDSKPASPTESLRQSSSRPTLRSIHPRASFVRASTTMIRRQTAASITTSSPRCEYVDRGTDAGNLDEFDDGAANILEPAKAQSDRDESEEEEEESFTPVFPIVEDLVIHFSTNDNEIFDSVIRSYKNGTYPIYPVVKAVEDLPDSRDSGVQSPQIEVDAALRPQSNLTAETDDDGFHRRQEVDPYNDANNGMNGPRLWPMKGKLTTPHQGMQSNEPLTPAATPPPIPSEIAQKFHEFSPLNARTAVGIQNSLRTVLNMHFPPETTKYRQYPWDSKVDRFWKPVFRDDEGHGNEGRTVDQIIAIGSENGVSEEFSTEILGHIERFGIKSSGLSRSGKLDIRYLLSNAMQNLAYSQASEISREGASNPEMLASLIIPQIETYLCHNQSIRLLTLQYPASHFSTVLAIRKLIGPDLFKVAGIVDTLSSDPPSKIPRATSPSSPAINLLSNAATDSFNSRRRLVSSFVPAPDRGGGSGPTRTGFSNPSSLSINLSSAAAARKQQQQQSHISQLLAKQPSTTSLETTNTSTTMTSAAATAGTATKKPKEEKASFSKANFLLPSTATEAEIAAFLAAIRAGLAEKSSFYVAESSSNSFSERPYSIPALPMQAPPVPTSPLPGNSSSSSSRDAKDYGSLAAAVAQPRLSTSIPDKQSGGRSGSGGSGGGGGGGGAEGARAAQQQQQQHHGHAPQPSKDYAASIRTNKTSATERERREARERQSEREWAEFKVDDDDDEDEFSRKLMPRGAGRRVRKPNSRKALKWLGLA